MDFLKLAEGRYSCKSFSDREIEQEKLDAVLQAGRLAPTAKNAQPQHIYLVRTPEMLKKVDEVCPCRYGAPCVAIVAYRDEEAFHFPDGRGCSGDEDVSIVASHMMLEAYSLGIDSCWLNLFKEDEVKAAFGIPENERVVLLMDFGYAAEGAEPKPNHFKRKAIEETVTFI